MNVCVFRYQPSTNGRGCTKIFQSLSRNLFSSVSNVSGNLWSLHCLRTFKSRSHWPNTTELHRRIATAYFINFRIGMLVVRSAKQSVKVQILPSHSQFLLVISLLLKLRPPFSGVVVCFWGTKSVVMVALAVLMRFVHLSFKLHSYMLQILLHNDSVFRMSLLVKITYMKWRPFRQSTQTRACSVFVPTLLVLVMTQLLKV